MTPTYDVLVVGAGYIGCAVAYGLAKVGLHTALLERDLPGSGASGANYGSVQVQDAELDHSLPLTAAGSRCFAGLEAELGMSVGYRTRGSLLIIESEAQWKLMAARLPALHAAGIAAELIPSARVPELEPGLDPRAAMGACYHPHEGQVWPFALMHAYLRGAARYGAEICTDTEVTGFTVRGGRLYGLDTNRGPFAAPVAVLTSGAWTPGLGRLLGREWAIPHVHGQALVTERSALELRNHIASASFFESMHVEPGAPATVALAVGQSPYGHMLLGESGAVTDNLGSRATDTALAAIAAEVIRFFPSFAGLRAVRGWASPVAFTPDGLPFLGAVGGIEGLVLATAFKSTVIVTPLVSRLIAQLILTGRTELDLSAFSPDRPLTHV